MANVSNYNHLLMGPEFSPAEGSLCRRMRDMIGVICRIWRSVQGYRIKIECRLAEPIRPIQSEEDWRRGVAYTITHNSLAKGARLCKTAVEFYLTTLQAKYKENFQFCSNYTKKRQDGVVEELPPLEIGSDVTLAFPLFVKGDFGNFHTLTVVVDPGNRKVEFYDPKGLTIKDRAHDHVLGSDVPLLQVVREIWTFYADESWELKENTTRHQDDGYNSGVHVCNYLKNRCDRVGYETLFAKGLTFAQASRDVRRDMIQDVDNYYSSTNTEGV